MKILDLRNKESKAPMNQNPVKKVCSLCKVNKPLDEFWKEKGQRLGVKSRCKVCMYIDKKSSRNKEYKIRICQGVICREKGGKKFKSYGTFFCKACRIAKNNYSEVFSEESRY